MNQPEEVITKGQEKKVCKFMTAVSRLKQASKQWQQKFNKVIIDFKFTINEHDKCIYSKV